MFDGIQPALPRVGDDQAGDRPRHLLMPARRPFLDEHPLIAFRQIAKARGGLHHRRVAEHAHQLDNQRRLGLELGDVGAKAPLALAAQFEGFHQERGGGPGALLAARRVQDDALGVGPRQGRALFDHLAGKLLPAQRRLTLPPVRCVRRRRRRGPRQLLSALRVDHHLIKGLVARGGGRQRRRDGRRRLRPAGQGPRQRGPGQQRSGPAAQREGTYARQVVEHGGGALCSASRVER